MDNSSPETAEKTAQNKKLKQFEFWKGLKKMEKEEEVYQKWQEWEARLQSPYKYLEEQESTRKCEELCASPAAI